MNKIKIMKISISELNYKKFNIIKKHIQLFISFIYNSFMILRIT